MAGTPRQDGDKLRIYRLSVEIFSDALPEAARHEFMDAVHRLVLGYEDELHETALASRYHRYAVEAAKTTSPKAGE